MKNILNISPGENNLLKKVLKLVSSNQELQTLWQVANTTATKKLNMTDHGMSHFILVAENSLIMHKLLAKSGAKMSLERFYKLNNDYSELVVLLAALLHDIGMAIHRDGHEEFSLLLADQLLRDLLSFLPEKQKTIIKSETLHAIISHRSDGKPLTIEAGIVRVADALDMTRNRTIDYGKELIDIYQVSVESIDEVEIRKGKSKPIQINIVMNHTAGIFQVDDLMRKKVIGSGIEKYLDIKVYIEKNNKRELFKDIN